MDAIPLSKIAEPIRSIRDHFERRQHIDDATGRELRHVLRELDLATPGGATVQGSGHSVIRHLEPALARRPGQLTDVIDAFRPFFAGLPWRYSYASRADAPGLELNMGWAELVGPVAPFRSDTVCLGFTLIGPRINYPLHWHPAVEVYLVINGTAIWTAGQQSARRAPGEYILHPSKVLHAMRTEEEPLLAVYTWSGDVNTLSAYGD